MVTLVHGPNEIEEPLLAGFTLGVAIRAFSAQLNLGTTVQAFVQGSVVHMGYMIRENDQIEFLKPYGKKGNGSADGQEKGPNMLTVAQVAKELGLSVTTVYGLANRGKLPVHRFGGAVRISREDLDYFVASCREYNPPSETASMPFRKRLKHLRY